MPKPRRAIHATASILDAAKALFLDHGYDGVSLDAVAARAGCARQTLYNRFGSKEALFHATVEHHWSYFDLDELFAAPAFDPRAVAPPDLLRRVAESIVGFITTTDQVAFTRLVVAESRRWAWIGEEFYRLGKGRAIAAFTRKLQQMTALGLLECPNVELAAHQFVGLIQELVLWPRVMAIGEPLKALPAKEDVVRETVAMFLSRYGT